MAYWDQGEDTICALSTPSGTGGVGMIRVSGNRVKEIGRQCCHFLPENPTSHRAYVGYFRRSVNQETIDQVVVTYFQKGSSYTGEAVLEVSCHGNPGIYSQILNELVKLGCRVAEPGEFTYRSFMNGRMDLVQAESVLALIESRSKRSSQQALSQLGGGLSKVFTEIEDELVELLAHLEATIDFADEELETFNREQWIGKIGEILLRCQKLRDSYRTGRFLQQGYKVALVGAPNVGKSSLLNALAEEDRMIVAEAPGTTRDSVEIEILVKGVRISLVDTAGIRQTDDQLELLGIDRTRAVIERSDLILAVYDVCHGWNAMDEVCLDGQEVWYVGNKIDLESHRKCCHDNQGRDFYVSALEGQGIKKLREALSETVDCGLADHSEVVLVGRHFELLEKINRYLERARELSVNSGCVEFVAFELTEALKALEKILGKQWDDQVIDRIFGEFCVGK